MAIDAITPASNAFQFLAMIVTINKPPMMTPIAVLVPDIPIP